MKEKQNSYGIITFKTIELLFLPKKPTGLKTDFSTLTASWSIAFSSTFIYYFI